MYFTATITIHHSGGVALSIGGGSAFHGGVALFMGGGIFHVGVVYPWGGLTLVLTWLKAGRGGGIHGGVS